jgi:asparagine synthase (glutamine-hydrolysing)
MARLPLTKPVANLQISGLWGLLRTDGGPPTASDAQKLGFRADSARGQMEARDDAFRTAAHNLENALGQTHFLGWIADSPDLAQRLGLAAATPLALLAQAALLRFGNNLPAEMLGEWSLCHRGKDGDIWLMVSAAKRDRIFFSYHAPHLAFAPDIVALSKLDWIGDRFDSEGMLRLMGRYPVRSRVGWRTIFSAVEQLPEGGSVHIGQDGSIRRHVASAFTPQTPFQGTAHDALKELERTVRQVLHDRMAFSPDAAFLLSGGLDSSTLVALAAQSSDKPLTAFCSVSPAGTEIPDEYSFAETVAKHCGVQLHPVVPDDNANPYRPSPSVLAGSDGPMINHLHCLSTAFQQAAGAKGATTIFDGLFGEMSITAKLHQQIGLRPRLHALRSFIRRGGQTNRDMFHIAVAPHRIETWHDYSPDIPKIPASALSKHGIGYLPGCIKAQQPTTILEPGGLRQEYPYRDIRLLRLYASLPDKMVRGIGVDRGPVRAIGKGILPENIRLRERGMPIDPGRDRRLQIHAETAQARIAIFRKAEVEDWLDLDWLDATLARIAAQGVADIDIAFRAQLTSTAAEYLTWLRLGEIE